MTAGAMRWLGCLLLVAGCASARDLERVPHPDLVEIRPSLVPGAGMGLFATSEIREGTYIGHYTGTFLPPDVPAETTYLFELPACAQDETHSRIIGDRDHYISKVNFAPSTINGRPTHLQSTTFYTYCEKPFIRLFATRTIAPGEEIYTDYGPDYDYAFMDRADVQQHFLRVCGIDSAPAFTWDYGLDAH